MEQRTPKAAAMSPASPPSYPKSNRRASTDKSFSIWLDMLDAVRTTSPSMRVSISYYVDCRERTRYNGDGQQSRGEANMHEETPFHQLIARVRGGDGNAAEELVRRYEPAIRRVVRLRLTDTRMRRAFDSMDVCQSVLASFFVRAALGQYELGNSDQLLKLLAQMARHKVTDHMRRERAERRDMGRRNDDAEAAGTVAAGDASPSRQVAGKELLAEFRKRLSAEEAELADLRAQGREWADIGLERGESPEALRKRLARGLDRVAQQLGLDETDHE